MKKSVTLMVATAVSATSLMVAPAHARDFFSSFFGGIFNERSAPASSSSTALPFAEPGTADPGTRPSAPRYASSGGAYCVRTCDGRYFPLNNAGGGQSKAETCKSLCPASETKVVYGSDIDSAATDAGKPYSSLPNAFRYRTELVNGCTCNGHTTGGLAQINPESDPTLRKGDLVASANGTLVASRNGPSDSRRAANYSPARRRGPVLQTIPVVAAE